MKKPADKLFSQEEMSRIKDAVCVAESGTTGEIVVMVVDYSDTYPEAATLGGVIVGSFLSLLTVTTFFDSSLWEFLPLSFILFFPAVLIFRKIPVLKSALISRARKEDAVRRRALAAFYEKGLYKTRDNTGVLFFLSVLERKVWVLADSGIISKIDQATLNTFAGGITLGIREGRACQAVFESVDRMGRLLAEHFPVKPDDTDELANDVIQE